MTSTEIVTNPFVWDGSVLGKFEEKDIVTQTWSVKKDTYWRLKINEFETVAMIKGVKSRFSCVIDELKPVFGLPKLGTHMMKIGTRDILLIKANVINVDGKEFIQDEILLSEIGAKPESRLFTMQVRETFAFRELLGLKSSYESSIRIRIPKKGLYYPVSYVEVSNSSGSGYTLPNSVLKKWFDANDDKGGINAYIRKLVCYPKDSNKEASIVMSKYQSEIENVINRVDKEYIWMSSMIIDKIARAIM